MVTVAILPDPSNPTFVPLAATVGAFRGTAIGLGVYLAALIVELLLSIK